MIDDIKPYLEDKPLHQKLNFLREYLQCIILKIISDTGVKSNITFTGGTALRIIYKTNRFSEYIDFSLTEKRGYNFNNLIDIVSSKLIKYGFNFEIKRIKTDTINSFFIRFNDLLYELDLSLQKSQKLSIKVEIDSNPPIGGKIEEYIHFNRFYFVINHYTPESLFALKLHAILFRRYQKGRDYYDLIYFLNKNIIPDIKLLNNAIHQTEKFNKAFTLKDIILKLKNKIEILNEKKIIDDIKSFILKQDELKLLNKKNILLFIKQYENSIGKEDVVL